MANKCTWWQVYSALVHIMVYQISRVCIKLMYMQHNHMLYGKLHRHYYLVFDQYANYNAYSTPLHHEVCNVDHKMVILGIYFCCKNISQIGVKHQHYPERYTVCLSIFFPWIVYCFCPDQTHHFCGALLSDGVEIPWRNLHHLFGCQCIFASGNKICFIR